MTKNSILCKLPVACCDKKLIVFGSAAQIKLLNSSLWVICHSTIELKGRKLNVLIRVKSNINLVFILSTFSVLFRTLTAQMRTWRPSLTIIVEQWAFRGRERAWLVRVSCGILEGRKSKISTNLKLLFTFYFHFRLFEGISEEDWYTSLVYLCPSCCCDLVIFNWLVIRFTSGTKNWQTWLKQNPSSKIKLFG